MFLYFPLFLSFYLSFNLSSLYVSIYLLSSFYHFTSFPFKSWFSWLAQNFCNGKCFCIVIFSFFLSRASECQRICVRSELSYLTLLGISIGQWLCGSVGRAVASDTRGPRFESSHRQKIIYIEHLFPVNCVLKRQK